MRLSPRRVLLLAWLGAALATVTACGSSTSDTGGAAAASSSSSTTTSTGTTAVETSPVTASSSSSASAGNEAAATVQVHTASLGMILVDVQGRTLYLFKKDTQGTSTCSGQCAVVWPPLLEATPHAGSGVDAAKLSTVKRADGTSQVVYGGHPLYYFKNDKNPGDTNGESVNGFGAEWDAVSPTGNAAERGGA